MHSLRNGSTHIFGLEAELIGHQIDGFSIHALVDANHHADAHAGGDNLGHRHVHHAGQLVGRHKFRQFQNLAFTAFFVEAFLGGSTHLVALLAAVFGTVGKTLFAGQTCQGLFHFIGHIFVRHLRLQGDVALLLLLVATLLILVALIVLVAEALFVFLAAVVGHFLGFGRDVHLAALHAVALFLALS